VVYFYMVSWFLYWFFVYSNQDFKQYSALFDQQVSRLLWKTQSWYQWFLACTINYATITCMPNLHVHCMYAMLVLVINLSWWRTKCVLYCLSKDKLQLIMFRIYSWAWVTWVYLTYSPNLHVNIFFLHVVLLDTYHIVNCMYCNVKCLTLHMYIYHQV